MYLYICITEVPQLHQQSAQLAKFLHVIQLNGFKLLIITVGVIKMEVKRVPCAKDQAAKEKCY
jgi:hypothetical protein